MADDELLLVKRCLKGDSLAITALVERFQSEVYGLCVRILRHNQDAEDVSQEVFIRVFRSLNRWDNSRPLKPWILGIAVNRCRTWLSKRSKYPDSVDYLHDTVPGRPEDDSKELILEIRLALEELRWEYRTVFVMYHEQGLPYEEIAQAMDRPEGTIKTWLHRARIEMLDRLRRRGMITEVGHELS